MDDSFIVLTSSPSAAQASCQATLSSAPSFAAALQRGHEPWTQAIAIGHLYLGKSCIHHTSHTNRLSLLVWVFLAQCRNSYIRVYMGILTQNSPNSPGCHGSWSFPGWLTEISHGWPKSSKTQGINARGQHLTQLLDQAWSAWCFLLDPDWRWRVLILVFKNSKYAGSLYWNSVWMYLRGNIGRQNEQPGFKSSYF